MAEISNSPKINNFKNTKSTNLSPISSYRSPLLSNRGLSWKNSELEGVSVDYVLELRKRNENLLKEIDELENESFKEEQLTWYIEQLHAYNEIKDAAQSVIGHIAVRQETTVRKIHEKYGMKEED